MQLINCPKTQISFFYPFLFYMLTYALPPMFYLLHKLKLTNDNKIDSLLRKYHFIKKIYCLLSDLLKAMGIRHRFHV